jgi:predicted AAA+ superfamily ATPase
VKKGRSAIVDEKTLLDNLEYFKVLVLPDVSIDESIANKLTDAGVHIINADEIQKIPALLDEVHRLIEKNAKLQFILTGSSPRKLRRASSNLLGGRASTCHFHPLTAMELGSDFDLVKALRYGLLPTIYDSEKNTDPVNYLAGYIEAYLREEILQEGLTRNIHAFNRFLEAASFSQGEVLNVTLVARECTVHRKVVESYFQIL